MIWQKWSATCDWLYHSAVRPSPASNIMALCAPTNAHIVHIVEAFQSHAHILWGCGADCSLDDTVAAKRTFILPRRNSIASCFPPLFRLAALDMQKYADDFKISKLERDIFWCWIVFLSVSTYGCCDIWNEKERNERGLHTPTVPFSLSPFMWLFL